MPDCQNLYLSRDTGLLLASLIRHRTTTTLPYFCCCMSSPVRAPIVFVSPGPVDCICSLIEGSPAMRVAALHARGRGYVLKLGTHPSTISRSWTSSSQSQADRYISFGRRQTIGSEAGESGSSAAAAAVQCSAATCSCARTSHQCTAMSSSWRCKCTSLVGSSLRTTS